MEWLVEQLITVISLGVYSSQSLMYNNKASPFLIHKFNHNDKTTILFTSTITIIASTTNFCMQMITMHAHSGT